MRIKIRTAIAVLVAGSAVVAANGLTAATSSAAPNTGGGSAAHQQHCEDLWTLFEGDVDAADQADQAGDTKTRDAKLDDAAAEVNAARSAGCDWASRLRTTPVITIGPAI
jgi:hypothetical protein